MLIFTLISAPKCVSSNGCVLLSSSSALQPWVGLGVLGCVYYSFKNLSVHTLTDDSINFTLNIP